MAKYTELQTRKLISSYGGVGSIIETTEGSLLIKEFDNWIYFIEINKGRIEVNENENISDERLLNRLKYYFPNLECIIKVPANYPDAYNVSKPKLRSHIINSEYFPKWMYCNRCGSFMHLDDWYEGWKAVYNSKDANIINDSFSPPKCYKCYQKETKIYNKYQLLEQVRFIMTAPNGEIKDLPWDKWTNLSKEKDENGQTYIKFNGKCCNKQDLHYIKSDKFSDFSGVQVKCKNPDCPSQGKPETLSGLFGLRLPDFDNKGEIKLVKDKDGNIVLDNSGNPQKILFKPVIRTSNSVYYPLITNSLFLPSKESVCIGDKKLAIGLKEKGKTINEISSLLNLNIELLNELFEPQDFIKEADYRLKEYQYLNSTKDPKDDNLVFEQEKSSLLNELGITKLLRIKRLKLTSVQTGYSRQVPIDKDLLEDHSLDNFISISKHSVKAKYTSSEGERTKILPGVESFGEGIFIEFNQQKLKEWHKEQIKKDNYINRIEALKNNAMISDFRLTAEKNIMLNNFEYLSSFIFIHTLSHILIKELEFLTGYSATSISERLYINENEMRGVLIYTIAGAEGSYGGLVSQANSERFIKILNSGLERARDCASDPICYNSDGQGLGGLNLAACYSCSLLPETSCEEYNSYLDRALLIDEEFGFYKNM